MKKAVFILCLVIIVFLFLRYAFFKAENETQNLGETTTPIPTTYESNVASKINNYSYSYIKTTPLNVDLIANFEQKISGTDMYKGRDCLALTSASFYTKEDRPIGLFKNSEGTIKNFVKNDTFDGVITIDNNENIDITRTDALQTVSRIALQSGPIVIENSNPAVLKLKNDENARRVVLATTAQNDIYFFIFYDERSLFKGPLLIELPKLLTDMSNSIGVSFKNAINLDGGSASLFITENIALNELTHSGGFFCVR